MSKAALYKKIWYVQQDITSVKKSSRNDFHGYDYATEADFLKAIKPLLKRHQLTVFPISCQITSTETYEVTRKAGDKVTNHLVSVSSKYLVADIETGESIEVEFPGSGEDSSDKGTYKAITGANKYALYKLFLVPTGDDPEKETAPSGYKSLRTVPAASKTAPVKTEEGFAPCDSVSCKNKANLKYGKLCYSCNKFVKEGGSIKNLRSEGAVAEEDIPLTANGAPDFS